MNLVVTLEHRFDRTPDGKVWTQTTYPYRFWERYLEVFDGVRVVARVRDVSEVPADWKQSNGEKVDFAAVPYYVGPWQYLKKATSVRRAAINSVRPGDAVILRVGSTIAAPIQSMLRSNGRPYAVEVVADPYDVFSTGSVKHPLRRFFRWSYPRSLRKHCRDAAAAAYVTQHALQNRYPCANYSVGVSDVDLPERMLVAEPRTSSRSGPIRLVFVGTMAQLYKAPDVLLEAVSAGIQQGLDLRLTLIGDGKHRSELESRAKQLGISDRVEFLGQIAGGEAVIAELDRADLFVLPSHQEGLPRAMVEAMARGLPCIGSTVGGFPELLPPEDLVLPGNVEALTQKFEMWFRTPSACANVGTKSPKAAEYRDEELRQARLEFYRYVFTTTEAWMKEMSCRSC